MKYKKFTFEMKKKIVAEAMQAKRFKSVSIKYDVAFSTLGGWLSDDELNPDKEYARTRREKKDNASRGSRVSIKKPNDPIPEGIVIAAKTKPEEVVKKRFEAIKEKKNIRRLCSIAGVSTKCYYAFIKGPTEKEISDESLKVIIKNLQNSYDNSLCYRKMTDRLKSDYDINIGKKKVLDLMNKAEALSAVRRRHYSE